MSAVNAPRFRHMNDGIEIAMEEVANFLEVGETDRNVLSAVHRKNSLPRANLPRANGLKAGQEFIEFSGGLEEEESWVVADENSYTSTKAASVFYGVTGGWDKISGAFLESRKITEESSGWEPLELEYPLEKKEYEPDPSSRVRVEGSGYLVTGENRLNRPSVRLEEEGTGRKMQMPLNKGENIYTDIYLDRGAAKLMQSDDLSPERIGQHPVEPVGVKDRIMDAEDVQTLADLDERQHDIMTVLGRALQEREDLEITLDYRDGEEQWLLAGEALEGSVEVNRDLGLAYAGSEDGAGITENARIAFGLREPDHVDRAYQ